MRRRSILKATLASAGAAALPLLSRPFAARGAERKVLRFIPQADLAVLDPIWTTAYVTRNHGFLVFDTLFGIDGSFKPQPQMLEGYSTENDGKLWRLKLREGLKFHDNTPVLARDCVASIRRWGARDAFGQALLAATDELSAPDDRTIVFRLKRPFPLLPDALGKAASNMPAMMPERLANTDPFKPVTEMVGSGPYRFKADERVPGARVVYERFEGYVPRQSGVADWIAGPKIAYFDRIEWNVIPDPSTAMAALQSGEMDWWEQPTFDLLPLLKRNNRIVLEFPDPTGTPAMIRPNHLWPPFDNPAIRRALLGAIDQREFMIAVAGTDPSYWRADVGFFAPASPMASSAGMGVFAGKRDFDKVKREIAEAGYKGERVVLMLATDFPVLQAMGNVAADMLKRVGFNLDVQAMDWGTLVQRRAKKDSPAAGGWNVFCTAFSGLDQFNPAGHVALRGNGAKAWFGWPTAPKIESLREAWFAARDTAEQKKICEEIQKQAFIDVPYIPIGMYFQPTAHQSSIAGLLKGLPLFWNVRRTA